MLTFALGNLLSRPVRSLLALLGLSVAIAGMVGLFSVAVGIDYLVADTVNRIPGLIVMQPGAPIPIFSRVPAAWGKEIAQLEGVGVVNPEVWVRSNVINGKRIVSPPRFLFGTEIDSRNKLQSDAYRDALIEGRFLTLQDRGTANTVISQQIAEEFQVGVGDDLQVDDAILQVVGIYHCGSIMLDVAIVLNITQVQQMARFDLRTVSAFYVEQAGDVDKAELIRRIQDLFRGRELETWQPGSLLGASNTGTSAPFVQFLSSLDQWFKNLALETASISNKVEPSTNGSNSSSNPPAARESKNHDSPKNQTESIATGVPESIPVDVHSAADWAEQFEEFFAELDIFLTIMTGIGVTVATLSTVNTMLMSVTERIIEFGILRANGWTKADIVKLITYESAVLGVGGGLLGCLLGWTGTQVVNSYWPTEIYLHAGPALLLAAVCFSTLLGVLGGLYPALWAARQTPMDAIRRG